MKTYTIPVLFSVSIPDDVEDEDVAEYIADNIDPTEDGSFEMVDYEHIWNDEGELL